MPSISCGFDDHADATGSNLLVIRGPTLLVHIGFDASFVVGSEAVPNLGMKDVSALVDTGATTSCLDSELAIALGLPIVDQAQISGVSGARTVNMHLAHIYVPTLNFVVWGEFAGVDLAAGGQSHQALIGRTFLRNFKLMYDGTTGKVTISSPHDVQFPDVEID